MAAVETIYNEAMAAWRRGEIDDFDVVLRVEEAGEDDPRTQHALGWVHRERGGHAAADEAFTRALEDADFSLDAAVWTACGDARLACARFQTAAMAYRRVLELAPGDAHATARLVAVEGRRRFEIATWMAGSITVHKGAGDRIECVGIGHRYAAVVRLPSAPVPWVTVHALSDEWDGDDHVIHDMRGRWVAAAPSGNRVAIGNLDETTIYAIDDRTATTMPAMTTAVWVDGDRLIGAYHDGRFALMTPRAPYILDEWRMPAPVNGVELLPGGRFAVCTTAASIELVDLRARVTVLRWPLTAAVPQIAVRDDGTMAALLTERTLSLWDLASRRRVVERGVAEPRRGLAFWPDGEHLVSGGERVELWDLASGRRRHLAALRGRLLVHHDHGFVVPEDLPEKQVRLVPRIRLGTLPAESPVLTP